MVPDRQKVRTDGQTESTEGRTNACAHGRRQNYPPPTSSGYNEHVQPPVDGETAKNNSAMLFIHLCYISLNLCNNNNQILFLNAVMVTRSLKRL